MEERRIERERYLSVLLYQHNKNTKRTIEILTTTNSYKMTLARRLSYFVLLLVNNLALFSLATSATDVNYVENAAGLEKDNEHVMSNTEEQPRRKLFWSLVFLSEYDIR